MGQARLERRGIFQPLLAFLVALPGQAFQVNPERLAVFLDRSEFELFLREGDQAFDEAFKKWARSPMNSST